MKVVLIAQDIAPSLAFEMLAVELASRGHDAELLIGKGKAFPVTLDEVRKTARNADIVVVGMSSSAKLAEPEVVACEEAILTVIPYGFYGDTYHCHERARNGSWFATCRQNAEFFFAINEEEASAAKDVLINPNLVSVATGNPTWENYFFPKYTRQEVRAKYGVADDEVLALAPGGKAPVVNIMIWGLLVDAMAELERKSRIMVAYHPGDRTPYVVDPDKGNAQLNIYGDLKTFSPVPVEFLPSDVKTSDVLPGADVVIEWGSSIAIEAAHQRIPVISVSTEVGRKRTFSTSKTEKWEAVELGISEEARDLKDLKLMLEELTSDGAIRQYLLETQARVYPKPQAKGSAVRKMADTLESIVNK